MKSVWVILGFVLGLVIGSFLNVVIHRLPRGESLVYPPSHCPACGHRLSAAELVPVLSWVAQRGRCRHCGARISPRYPLVELLTGVLFGIAAYLYPDPLKLVFAWAFLAILVALAFIDIDTYTLPDELTYGGLFLGLLAGGLGLFVPFDEALKGALLSAGLLALIGGYANLVLRRGRDGKPTWPIGLHEVYLAALLGGALGVGVGAGAALLLALFNLLFKKNLHLPEPVSLLLFPLVLAWRAIPGLMDGLLAAGAVALLGGLYWAFQPEAEDEEDDEPVALGFGDVKLLAMIAAWTGFWPAMLGLFVAVLAGAVLGLLLRQRKLPFGPYLALGGVVAFFWGETLLRLYLTQLGW